MPCSYCEDTFRTGPRVPLGHAPVPGTRTGLPGTVGPTWCTGPCRRTAGAGRTRRPGPDRLPSASADRPPGPRLGARHGDVTFRVTATDGGARAGGLTTAPGDVPTPAFMPVGTKGTVKTLHPDELRDLGAHILLGNTYHLHFRPGAGLIAELGGLHGFMGWDGPILTDSGGFQIFSLRDTLLSVDDDGVSFRSVYDGSPVRLTPESVAQIQANLGSDVAMCLDVCPPAGVPRAELQQAVRLTQSWAKRPGEATRAPDQLLYGITQGASDPDLRRRSIEEVTDLDFDGYALGALSVGEPRELMLDATAWAAPLLPSDRPRYFMGIGDTQGIIEVIERGIDMFD